MPYKQKLKIAKQNRNGSGLEMFIKDFILFFAAVVVIQIYRPNIEQVKIFH